MMSPLFVCSAAILSLRLTNSAMIKYARTGKKRIPHERFFRLDGANRVSHDQGVLYYQLIHMNAWPIKVTVFGTLTPVISGKRNVLFGIFETLRKNNAQPFFFFDKIISLAKLKWSETLMLSCELYAQTLLGIVEDRAKMMHIELVHKRCGQCMTFELWCILCYVFFFLLI